MPRGATRVTPLALERLEDRRLMAGVTPDDPHYVQQWGLETIQAPSAWEITTGSTRVSVAVIDTGVDYTHPDLYLNVWLNQEEIPREIRRELLDIDGDDLITFWDLNDAQNQGPGKITDLNGTGFVDGGDVLRPVAEGGWADGSDDGHNGYEDDLIGWDFFNGNNDPMAVSGSGTEVAGIIGAVGDNGEGVAGINWKVQLMPVQFLPHRDALSPDEFKTAGAAAALGIRYAVDNGAHVSNNSWWTPANLIPPEIAEPVIDAIDYAEARGQLMVFAAGNDAIDNDTSPSAVLPASLDHDNIISVAATTRLNRLDSSSNFGETKVDLGAPGERIWTTTWHAQPNFRYIWSNAVSATAHVAGTAALILACNPDLSYLEVKDLILSNVDKLPDLKDKVATDGRLNTFKAVSAALAAGTTVISATSAAAIPLPLSAGGFDGLPGGEMAKPAKATSLPITRREQVKQYRQDLFAAGMHDVVHLLAEERGSNVQATEEWMTRARAGIRHVNAANDHRLAADALFAQLAADDAPPRFERDFLRGIQNET